MDTLRTKQTSLTFLVWLTVGTFCLGGIILSSFLKPILFALALAIVFHPLHLWMKRRVRGPNLAALLSTSTVFLAMSVPVFALGKVLTSEFSDLYRNLNDAWPAGKTATLSWLGSAEQWMNGVIQHAGFTTFDAHRAIREHLSQAGGWIVQQAGGLLGSVTGVIFGAVVSAVALFLLFREGATLRAGAASILPLSADHMKRLSSGLYEVVLASIYGMLAIGLIQGSLTGLAFWLLGLSSPVLWGLITAIFSLIPIIGTGGVWIPAAIILLIGGHWVKAVILLAWGAALVNPVDNILRPYLVGRHAKLSTLYLFFAIVGGVKTLGPIGLLVGPALLSLAFVLVGILRDEMRERNREPAGADLGRSERTGVDSSTAVLSGPAH